MVRGKKLAVFTVVATGLVLIVLAVVSMRDWLLDQWHFYRLKEDGDGRYIAGLVLGHDGRRVAGAVRPKNSSGLAIVVFQ